MNIEVDFEERLNIVSGRISGELTREIAKHYFTEVGEIAASQSCNRVLTDVRDADINVTQDDMRTLAKELVQIGLSSSYRRAIVLREDVSVYKEWENHCFTAGHKNLRLFVDCDVAKEWLSGH
ncbi:hypothetical protein [Roseivirga misakiensis]|uniref:STAS/SEC14 domain-containing protein n=1 Tax=Roseivirga misakiensis TaxID=1563681 RepID=A0A1E5T165_9BACT|nr:hypothetical protein [Roseivirga misakiensis]OEK05106.1 hypothetical protein BFP71_16955 [Roseivirga misakiensis]